MSTEQLPTDGLRLAIEIIESTMAGPNARSRARSAIQSEHAQRVTLQHHAADQAQRIAELEAERDNTAAHVASIARQIGDEALQIDDIAVRVLAVVAERDTLRARLAEIEASPVPAIPDGWRLVAWGHEDGRVIPVEMMATARRDGGATLSSVKGYTIPLYAAPEAAR